MMDFDTFLDASKATLIHGTLPTTLPIPEKAIFHQGNCVFPNVILVSNYHSYKEKIIKLLPYHSFYGGHIPSRKVEPPYLAVHLKKKKNHQDLHLPAFPPKNSNFICQEVCNIPH